MAAKILNEFARQAQPPAPEVSRPTSRLSERETEVLELVAKGATNKEIAEALFIAESTVKNHLRNIMEKLHVHNRLQAALYTLHEKGGTSPTQKTP